MRTIESVTLNEVTSKVQDRVGHAGSRWKKRRRGGVGKSREGGRGGGWSLFLLGLGTWR